MQMAVASSSSELSRHILITGVPGIGKTTLIRRTIDRLKSEHPSMHISGFYTEEQRDSAQQRIGFNIVDITTGRRAPLASSNLQPPRPMAPRVGKYTVTLPEFESVAMDSLKSVNQSNQQQSKRLLIIDEIGKMENYSKPFVAEIERLFCGDPNGGDPNLCVLATIPVDRGYGLPLIVRKVKQAVVGSRLITVTKETRDGLIDDVIRMILSSMEVCEY